MAKLAAAAEEAAASTQAPPSPEPVTPVVDDPEPVQAEHGVTTDVTPEAEAVVREAPAPSPSAHPLSTQVPNPTPAADRALDLTRRVSADPAETTAAVVHVAETAAASTDPVEPTGHITAVVHHLGSMPRNLGSVPRRAVEVVQTASETLGKKAADLIAPDSVKSMPSPAEGLSEVSFGALPPVAIPGVPAVPPTYSHLGGKDTGLDGLLMRRPVELGGLETPWRPLALSGANSSSSGSPGLSADGARLPVAVVDSVDERSTTSTPIDGNGPKRWPGSPQSAASGPGTGSSFVPIAALLALLALAAPAIFRRLGGLADFRAPTPFVCALERPG